MQVKIGIGLALTLVILIFIPIYWATESGRQAAAQERFQLASEERGAELFTSHCATCHGSTGQGLLGPSLRGAMRDENTLVKTISRGVSGTLMPAFATEDDGSLELHQIQDVVTFILNWDDSLLVPATPTPSHTTEPTVTPTVSTTSTSSPTTTTSTSTATASEPPTMTTTTTAPLIDPRSVYAANCAPCHGNNREGTPNLGPALTPESLTTLTDVEVQDIISNGKTSEGMPPWKTILSEEEIRSLVHLIKHEEG